MTVRLASQHADGFDIGIEPEQLALLLEELAAQIRDKQIFVEKIEQSEVNKNGDWTKNGLELRFVKKRRLA